MNTYLSSHIEYRAAAHEVEELKAALVTDRADTIQEKIWRNINLLEDILGSHSKVEQAIWRLGIATLRAEYGVEDNAEESALAEAMELALPLIEEAAYNQAAEELDDREDY